MALQARRDVFQAIADPTRRGILNLIAHQSLNLNAIADNFDMSRPAISQHIKILTECGLIIVKIQGRERYCEVQPKQLSEVADWIEPFRQLWTERFNEMDRLLADLQTPKSQR
jgi:DNA-binding transcriptional ArsR family regulator